MGSFFIRRVFYAIIMLFMVSFVSFIIISLAVRRFYGSKDRRITGNGVIGAQKCASMNTANVMVWISRY